MVNSDLPSSAKEAIAEAQEMGNVPEGRLDLEWNEMVMCFERKEKKKFYQKSREVQALTRVLTKDNNCFLRIREWLKKARFLVYNNEWRLAFMFLRNTEKLLKETGRALSPVVR